MNILYKKNLLSIDKLNLYILYYYRYALYDIINVVMLYKISVFIIALCIPYASIANTDTDIIRQAEQLYNTTKTVCSGISDEISRIANMSMANTAVTTVGTASAGGALAAGIAKSQEDKQIETLINKICDAGGCTPDGIAQMSNEVFFTQVIQPMSEIKQLQEKVKKSKQLGNWRTGLMAGTIGTNITSAVISGLNIEQSELTQHIDACNQMISAAIDMESKLKLHGINPIKNPIVTKINNIKTWCNPIKLTEIEKIEKRMKGVLAVSVTGGAIGIVGTATSASANSNKYTDNKLSLTTQDKQKEKALNTTANVMAGANIATGATETGLNISLVNLTKKLTEQAKRCEEVLK